jgi:hypothetical protein
MNATRSDTTMSAETQFGATGSKKMEGAMADAKAAIQEIAEPLKDKAEEIAEQQKAAGTDRIRTLATAVHGAARELEGEMPRVASSVHDMAQKIEQTASKVRSKNIDELMSDLDRYAREQPGMVFGGAVIAGIVLSRFLKSSASGSVRQTPGA